MRRPSPGCPIARGQSATPAAAPLAYYFRDVHRTLGPAVTDRTQLQERAQAQEAAGDLGPLSETYAALARLTPDDAVLRAALASVEQRRGNFEAAERHYHLALQLDPELMAAWSNLGVIQRNTGRPDEAAASFRHAVTLDPANAAARVNLGLAACEADDLVAGIAEYRRALELAPDLPEAHFNLANAWCAVGDLSAAVAGYTEAIMRRPGYADARWNMAHALLALGDYARGWEAFEARWETAQLKADARPYAAPLWAGEDLAGKTIYIWGEQGFGDVLQFCRYVPLAAARGARVILGVQPHLMTLMASLAGVAQVLDLRETPSAFDFHCPVMSLPRAFGTTPDSVPAAVPYLFADPALAVPFQARMTANRRLHVGLVWSSGIRRHSDSLLRVGLEKSVLPALLSLLDHKSVQFFSLQVGESMPTGGLPMVDLSGDLRTFADTAAAISSLDLVISVDTAVAHLAGALGKPVWLLLNANPCWRWALSTASSPWYPGMRVFRQTSAGDWRAPLGAAHNALLESLATRTGTERKGVFSRLAGLIR